MLDLYLLFENSLNHWCTDILKVTLYDAHIAGIKGKLKSAHDYTGLIGNNHPMCTAAQISATISKDSRNQCYSGDFFYFCQYLHIGAGILSFGGDVFRL